MKNNGIENTNMPNEIVKQSDLKPVSIEYTRPHLTEGQRMICELLIQKQKDGEMLRLEDIQRLWMSVFCPNGYKRRGHYSKVLITMNSYTARTESKVWFKNNLGSCILKGRIMAIPVIDID